MNTEEQPRFNHVCEGCEFLGRVGAEDAYYCPQAGFPTVVLRWGDDNPDYRSSIHLAERLPDGLQRRVNALREA